MDILILGHSYLQIQQHRKANIQVYGQRLSYYAAFFFCSPQFGALGSVKGNYKMETGVYLRENW